MHERPYSCPAWPRLPVAILREETEIDRSFPVEPVFLLAGMTERGNRGLARKEEGRGPCRGRFRERSARLRRCASDHQAQNPFKFFRQPLPDGAALCIRRRRRQPVLQWKPKVSHIER